MANPLPLPLPDPRQVDRLTRAVHENVGLREKSTGDKIAALLRQIDPSGRAKWVENTLKASPAGAAWIDFVEQLLVHETYFFRHPVQLDFLNEEVLPILAADAHINGRTDLKVWCAGCATGEEAHTLAMLLGSQWQSMVMHGSAHILGTDVSRQSLALANAGAYRLNPGLNSFRAVPPNARHFFPNVLTDDETMRETDWQAPNALRAMVRFAWHNLVAMPPPRHDFDLVICRNTLFYFDAHTAQQVVEKLGLALRVGGFLMLGPADPDQVGADFAAAGNEQATVYRKTRNAVARPVTG